MKKEIYLCTLLPIVLILASCYGFSMAEREEPAAYSGAGRPKEAPAEPEPAPAPQPSARDEMAAVRPTLTATETMSLEPSRVEEERTERKRVFSGFCTLLVDDVEETRTKIADIADESIGDARGEGEHLQGSHRPPALLDEVGNYAGDSGKDEEREFFPK